MLFDITFRPGGGFWETVHNIKWMAIAQIVKMGGSLVVGVFVVRYLGPTQYGTLSYAIAVCGLFNIISSLGLDFPVVNAIALAKDPSTEEEVLGTAFLLKIVANVITALAAIAFSWVTHPTDTTTIILVAMLSSAAISQGFDVVGYFYQAKTKSRLTVVPQLILFVLGSAARVIMVRMRAPLLAFGMLVAVETSGRAVRPGWGLLPLPAKSGTLEILCCSREGDAYGELALAPFRSPHHGLYAYGPGSPWNPGDQGCCWAIFRRSQAFRDLVYDSVNHMCQRNAPAFKVQRGGSRCLLPASGAPLRFDGHLQHRHCSLRVVCRKVPRYPAVRRHISASSEHSCRAYLDGSFRLHWYRLWDCRSFMRTTRAFPYSAPPWEPSRMSA